MRHKTLTRACVFIVHVRKKRYVYQENADEHSHFKTDQALNKTGHALIRYSKLASTLGDTPHFATFGKQLF